MPLCTRKILPLSPSETRQFGSNFYAHPEALTPIVGTPSSSRNGTCCRRPPRSSRTRACTLPAARIKIYIYIWYILLPRYFICHFCFKKRFSDNDGRTKKKSQLLKPRYHAVETRLLVTIADVTRAHLDTLHLQKVCLITTVR